MNYEALGNSVAHLHWWLTPRHRDDPHPRGPIWEDADFLRALRSGPAKSGHDHDASTRRRILRSLEAEDVEIELPYV
jgi:diadenosine tetraphosphate (Ap4A) HIT family hydrolase